MNPINDINIIAATLNFLTMFGNIWYSFKIKETQANNALITYWKEKHEVAVNDLKTSIEKKNNYKNQYNKLLVEHEKLKGELNTYKKLHNHE